MAAAMTVLRHLDPPVDWDELPPGSELAAIEPAERDAREWNRSAPLQTLAHRRASHERRDGGTELACRH